VKFTLCGVKDTKDGTGMGGLPFNKSPVYSCLIGNDGLFCFYLFNVIQYFLLRWTQNALQIQEKAF